MCAAVYRYRHLVKATEVTAGLAESNGSLLPGLWRDSLHITYGLTACTPGSAPGPTLGNEYGKTSPFTFISICRQRRNEPRPQIPRTKIWVRLNVQLQNIKHHNTEARLSKKLRKKAFLLVTHIEERGMLFDKKNDNITQNFRSSTSMKTTNTLERQCYKVVWFKERQQPTLRPIRDNTD